MLKRENTLEMTINTINTFNDSTSSKEALTLLSNYRSLITMFFNSVSSTNKMSDEDKLILKNHTVFYKGMLNQYISKYNSMLVNAELQESKNALKVISETQYILEYYLVCINFDY